MKVLPVVGALFLAALALFLVLLLPGGLEQRAVGAPSSPGRGIAVAWPVYGRVTSPFGLRTDPVTGEEGRMHYGIDIAAAHGTPVQAATDGHVEYASHYGDYGNLVMLRAYDGADTWYAHLSAIAVRLTEDVRQGEVIGYVGSTGKSTGDHLHFEVRDAKGTLPVDPLQVLGYRAAEPAEAAYPDDEMGLPADFARWVSVRVGILELPTLSYIARDGQTMVHLRSLAEALEGEVDWDDATQSATIRLRGQSIKLTLGQPLAEVDGRMVMTYHPPSLWNKNLMVPLRLVAEAFGLQLEWDGVEGRVTVY